jgi:hypothetical protein
VDWIRLAQDRDRWRALVSAGMNLRVLAPQNMYVYVRVRVYMCGCVYRLFPISRHLERPCGKKAFGSKIGGPPTM